MRRNRRQMMWLYLFLILLSLNIVKGEYRPFDCRRPGSSCAPMSNLCNSTGQCICPEFATGPDCTVIKVWLETSNGMCSLECLNGGRCFVVGLTGKSLCLCPPEYYGTLCNRKRVDIVECNAENMTININPYGSFTGNIYPIAEPQMQPRCRFTPAVEEPFASDLYLRQYEGWLFKYNLAKIDCGLRVTKLTEESDMIYQTDILTDYGGDYVTEFNLERHRLSCIHAGDGHTFAVVSGDIRTNEISNPALNGADETKLYGTVKLTTLNFSSLQPIEGPVTVGDKLTIQVKLVNTKDYSDFRVESCSFVDRRNTTDRLVKHYIQNSCFYPPSYDVRLEPELFKDGNSRTVFINFRAFRFKNSNVLFVECEMQYCKHGEENECATKSCEDGTRGYGRKRRQVQPDTRDATSNTVTKTLIVLDTDEDLIYAGDRPTANCEWQFYFILTTTVLVSVLLILTGCFAVIHFRIVRKSKN